MGLDANLQALTSGNRVEVDANNNLFTRIPGFDGSGISRGGGPVSGPALYSETDGGEKTGFREMVAPETDHDHRLRVAHDVALDQELFNYTAQNTGKHTFTFTTLAATISTGGITTNSGSITTTTTGLTFGTHAMFPLGGTNTVICETSAAFSAQPTANVIIDFGMFLRGAATPFSPLDGVYFRLSSSGMSGVVNSGGVETATAIFPLSLGTGTYVYSNNATNRFLIQADNVGVTFWINNYMFGEILTPIALNSFCKSSSLPWSFRHAIVGGAAGAVLQAVFSDYRVYFRGPLASDSFATTGSRIFGSYQGLSGGTMGSLANYANSANPTAAVPTNTTAALGVGLGGQFWETFSLAVNTDGIIWSFQVPIGSATVQGRRLVILGIGLTSHIQTVLAGGPMVRQYSLAFGHTAVSLATIETTSMATLTTKAPRRIALSQFTQAITAAQAVSTLVAQSGYPYQDFTASPIYVNQGEFVALVVKGIGTVGTTGTIAHVCTVAYGWE